jgi:hypothetical protein
MHFSLDWRTVSKRVLPLLALTTTALAQSSPVRSGQVQTRTADGHSDLQGTWTNSTMTLLERPIGLGRSTTLTEDEAAKFEEGIKRDRSSDRRDGLAEVDVGRAYNELFFDRGSALARVGGEIRTSIIVDPPDGRLPPYTPEGWHRLADATASASKHPSDRAQDRSLAERCLLWAAEPPMLPAPYNSTYQIIQTTKYVMILIEMMHDVRIIPLDGSPHLPSDVRLWMGDSRGHWEGATLVVDTTNFTNKTSLQGSDENLHVTERFTRVDANTILYSFTIDDPTTFLRPWTGELPFIATPGPVYEYACHEGNRALRNILLGARAEEKQIEKRAGK